MRATRATQPTTAKLNVRLGTLGFFFLWKPSAVRIDGTNHVSYEGGLRRVPTVEPIPTSKPIGRDGSRRADNFPSPRACFRLVLLLEEESRHPKKFFQILVDGLGGPDREVPDSDSIAQASKVICVCTSPCEVQVSLLGSKR